MAAGAPAPKAPEPTKGAPVVKEAEAAPVVSAPPVVAKAPEPPAPKIEPPAPAPEPPPPVSAPPALEPVYAPPAVEPAAAPVVFEPAQMAPAEMPAEGITVEGANGNILKDLRVGSFLDIFSNSYQAWCPGVVQGMDSSSVLVAYQVPGKPAEPNINTKTLAIESPELRSPLDQGPWLGAVVEVYSHSNQVWCPSRIQEIVNGVAMVAFFYPNSPPDSDPVLKSLPLGDQDLRLPGAENAMQAIAGQVGHDALTPGCHIEVYSNSLGVWCPGVVHDLKDGVVTIAFYYPDMDANNEPPAIKELPLGHQDIRLPTTFWNAGADDGVVLNPNVNPADYVEGVPIEIFSHSRQIWILGSIKEVSEGAVVASFLYPDMPSDSELYEKVLPIGHPDLRLPVVPP